MAMLNAEYNIIGQHKAWLPHLDYIPDIIEFATSPMFLDRTLYPRQATLLKLIFLQTELLTDYDYGVIAEWTSGEFHLPEPESRDPEKPLRFEGEWGIQPDILERVDQLKAEGHKWFSEVLAVLGRRAGKGYIGGICGAYVLWHYICLADPQDHYSIDRSKRLTSLVYAGKKEQAKVNQWRDLKTVITEAPCFRDPDELFYGDLLDRSMAESFSFFAPKNMPKVKELRATPNRNEVNDLATFEVIPKEATPMAGRGPASFMLYFDEMAHVVATGASRGADELYDTATPSLDQFGVDGFIYAGSSPWQMTGKFYELCQQALEVEHETLEPVYPDKLIIQLASWEIYKDWKIAHLIPLVSDRYRAKLKKHGRAGGWRSTFYHVPSKEHAGKTTGRCFQHIKKPVQTYDRRMRRLERGNPEKFAVERRSRWAAAIDAYLRPDMVDRMFQPWPEGRTLAMQTTAILRRTYAAHADPSKSGANFGWAIAHIEGPDDEGFLHVVFDKVHFWAPYHFDDGNMDYIEIGQSIGDDIVTFMPGLVTFDQFNSIEIMQRLRKRVRKRLPKSVQIEERTATAPMNWRVAETFKTALNMGLIHCFAGETTYLTREGLRTFNETVGTTQRVLTTGSKWVDAEIKSFGQQQLHKITLERAGATKVIHATAGHRWFVKGYESVQGTERRKRRKLTWEDACEIRRLRADGEKLVVLAEKFGVSFQMISQIVNNKIWQEEPPLRQTRVWTNLERTTAELLPGDRLASATPRPATMRVVPSPIGIMHGFVCGDGSRINRGTAVNLWGEKDAQVLPYFQGHPTAPRETPNGVKGTHVSNLPSYFKDLPDLNESPGYLYGWLAGYFAADGNVTKSGEVVFSSNSLDLIDHARNVCLRLGLGIHPLQKRWMVGKVDPGGKVQEPHFQYRFELMRSGLADENFFLIAEHRERFRASRETWDGRERLSWKVVSVEETDRIEEVFCAVVPETAAFVLEDYILTGNCPYHEQLELESKFLQLRNGTKVDHQDTGPVQTKDVWDAASNVVFSLIGDQMEAFLRDEFRAAGIHGSGQAWPGQDQQGMTSAASEDRETFDALAKASRRRSVEGVYPRRS